MRHFYSDYKNYYYLPKEDMAIHKSVAAYVDHEYREKCKAYNCYVRKTGTFIHSTYKSCLDEVSFGLHLLFPANR